MCVRIGSRIAKTFQAPDLSIYIYQIRVLSIYVYQIAFNSNNELKSIQNISERKFYVKWNLETINGTGETFSVKRIRRSFKRIQTY